MKKYEKLEPVKFDNFLWECFFNFLNTEGNYCEEDGGRRLKPWKEFDWRKVKNRNPRQVDDVMWKNILHNHLVHYKYN